MTKKNEQPVGAPTEVGQVGLFADLLKDQRAVTEKAKSAITELMTVRQQLVDGVEQIDQQLVEMRQIAGEVVETQRRGRTPGSSTGRSNSKKLEEFVYDALKKAGQKGLSKIAVGDAVRAAGFNTPSSPLEFANSCYVSGINKLTKRKPAAWVERFTVADDRKGRYRLTKAGQERK